MSVEWFRDTSARSDAILICSSVRSTETNRSFAPRKTIRGEPAGLGGTLMDVAKMHQHFTSMPGRQVSKIFADVTDATRHSVLSALEALFTPRPHPYRSGCVTGPMLYVVYYSGHGFRPTGDWCFHNRRSGQNEKVSFSDVLSVWKRCLKHKYYYTMGPTTGSPGAKTMPPVDLLIISDCCHSGAWASLAAGRVGKSYGVSVFAACQSDEEAVEIGGQGWFTSKIIEGANWDGFFRAYPQPTTPKMVWRGYDDGLGIIQLKPGGCEAHWQGKGVTDPKQ